MCWCWIVFQISTTEEVVQVKYFSWHKYFTIREDSKNNSGARRKNILQHNNTFQDFWIAFDMLFGQKKLLKNFPIYDKTSPPCYL